MKNNPLNPFIESDQWKFKAVEESRLAILERLRIEKKKEVDEILRKWKNPDILTNS